MLDPQAVLNQCEHVLPFHKWRRPLKDLLTTLADQLNGDEQLDRYGRGPQLEQFEAEVAMLFGKEAAIFMPSGTMAQQIALRMHCDRTANYTVAMHPTSHLDTSEHRGYQALHGIQRLQFGVPELVNNRVLLPEDFKQLGQNPGVILLELPIRVLGGQLPSWDDLLQIKSWANERNIPLHLDGARLWQCRPFYQMSYSEIASLFETIYLSFYKDLGGFAGSMLLGSQAFVDEAWIWRRRHGGELPTQEPLVMAAKVGFDEVIPVIDNCVAKAQAVAEIMGQFAEITINPEPPHVNMFHFYLAGEPKALTQRHLQIASETGTYLFNPFNASPVPGIAWSELQFPKESLDFDEDRIAPFLERFLSAD